MRDFNHSKKNRIGGFTSTPFVALSRKMFFGAVFTKIKNIQQSYGHYFSARLGMLKQRHERCGGFIALVSSIIIAVILLTAVVSLGSRGIMGRFILLDIENKQVSQALAEACVQIAMIKIVNDAEYVAVNVPAYVDTKTCTIVSVTPDTPSPSRSTIKTKGESRGATTNLEVIADSATADFISWQEVAAF